MTKTWRERWEEANIPLGNLALEMRNEIWRLQDEVERLEKKLRAVRHCRCGRWVRGQGWAAHARACDKGERKL